MLENAETLMEQSQANLECVLQNRHRPSTVYPKSLKRDFVNGADQLEPGPQLFASEMPRSLASGENGVQEGGGVLSTPPTVSSPKGGGAIQGMGEKFSANPVIGTVSLSIPIYATHTRTNRLLQPPSVARRTGSYRILRHHRG